MSMVGATPSSPNSPGQRFIGLFRLAKAGAQRRLGRAMDQDEERELIGEISRLAAIRPSEEIRVDSSRELRITKFYCGLLKGRQVLGR